RQEQHSGPGRMAHHGQPLPGDGVLLRCRQGRRIPVRSRLQKPEERLRVRRSLPRSVLHAAPRRAGEESRRPFRRIRFISSLLKIFMPISTLASHARRAALVGLSLGAAALFVTGVSTQSPRFYPDDPIARDPESQDASKAAFYEESQIYDLVYNLFVNSG